MIHLLTTHHSIGYPIQTEKFGEFSKIEGGPPNLVDLAVKYNLNPCYVVETSLAGLIPIYHSLLDEDINLVFGLKLHFVTDAKQESNDSAHRNIIFAKSKKGYQTLIKISTRANTQNFSDIGRIDYNDLYEFWNDDLVLACPFYSSFLAENLMTSKVCVPDFRGIKPIMFLERKGLPFDEMLRNATTLYAKENGLETQETNTVLYETEEDILAYLARRIMTKQGYGKGTIEAPNINHFGSSRFCFDNLKYYENISD
jgi:DNA polymerase III alpha subunit